MTHEEAIKELNSAYEDDIFRNKEYEACKIAINSIKENTKLKAENERLKELMPKICETCEYEDEIGYEEPCNSCNNRRNWKLKSEE